MTRATLRAFLIVARGYSLRGSGGAQRGGEPASAARERYGALNRRRLNGQIAAYSPEFDAIACRTQGMLESGVPQPAKCGTPGDFYRTSVFQFVADALSVWVSQTVRFIRRSCVWARRRRVKVGVNSVARSVACVPKSATARSSRHFVTSRSPLPRIRAPLMRDGAVNLLE
jgi:hypothetical protein